MYFDVVDKNIWFYLSQILGFISTIYYLYSDIQEDDKDLDKYYTLGNVFFLGHLLLLSSFIPAVTVFLAVVRSKLNNKYENNDYLKYTFVFIFSCIFIATLIFMKEWHLCLPALVSLIMTFALLYTKGNMLTLLVALCSVLWIIVGVNINSYSVIALESISIALLFYRYLKQNFKEKEKEKIKI